MIPSPHTPVPLLHLHEGRRGKYLGSVAWGGNFQEICLSFCLIIVGLAFLFLAAQIGQAHDYPTSPFPNLCLYKAHAEIII